MQPEQQQEILDLRSRKLTPKQIARKLGLKVSEVSTFLKSQSEQAALKRVVKGEGLPIAQCLVDIGCADALLRNTKQGNKNFDRGLGLVMVTRSKGYNRLIVATYLIDYWCLGLKDTIPPRNLNQTKYKNFVELSYSRFAKGYEEITLEQAQAIVWGAIDYADRLGLKPHSDFEKAKEHLGQSNNRIDLTFGREGKPCYIEGPYDDTNKIITTLQNAVGEGNFDYLMGIGM